MDDEIKIMGWALFLVAVVLCVAIVSCTQYNLAYIEKVKPEVVPSLVWPKVQP